MSTADAKTLIVLRHAKAGWPDAADDHARPLAERGHAQAPAAGDWLREHDLVPDAVVCSDALRTRQTCVWVCERLGELAPTPYLDPRLYGADAARALAVVNETEETTRRLLVVGHMPWVQELGMRLMSLDSDQDAALRMSEHYPTLGMQVFRVEKPWAELDGRDAALEGSEAFFQRVLGGVGQAGVDGAGVGKIEAVGRVLGVVKNVGSGLVNRHIAGVMVPVEVLACVYRAGSEGPVGIGVIVFRRHAWQD